MENLKIRMYQDGTSLVIYIDDCTPKIKDVLQGLFDVIMSPESSLESLPEEEIILPEGCGSLTGKTISEVLSENGHKGYANIVYLINKGVFQPDDKAEVQKILHEYIHAEFANIDPDEYTSGLNEEETDLFLKCFGNLISEQMRSTVKNILGYATYEDFLTTAPLVQKHSLVVTIIEDVKNC